MRRGIFVLLITLLLVVGCRQMGGNYILNSSSTDNQTDNQTSDIAILGRSTMYTSSNLNLDVYSRSTADMPAVQWKIHSGGSSVSDATIHPDTGEVCSGTQTGTVMVVAYFVDDPTTTDIHMIKIKEIPFAEPEISEDAYPVAIEIPRVIGDFVDEVLWGDPVITFETPSDPNAPSITVDREEGNSISIIQQPEVRVKLPTVGTNRLRITQDSSSFTMEYVGSLYEVGSVIVELRGTNMNFAEYMDMSQLQNRGEATLEGSTLVTYFDGSNCEVDYHIVQEVDGDNNIIYKESNFIYTEPNGDQYILTPEHITDAAQNPPSIPAGLGTTDDVRRAKFYMDMSIDTAIQGVSSEYHTENSFYISELQGHSNTHLSMESTATGFNIESHLLVTISPVGYGDFDLSYEGITFYEFANEAPDVRTINGILEYSEEVSEDHYLIQFDNLKVSPVGLAESGSALYSTWTGNGHKRTVRLTTTLYNEYVTSF